MVGLRDWDRLQLRRLARHLSSRVRDVGPALAWRKDLWSAVIGARLKRPWLNSVTFVAITGSAGKTAAKDLSAVVLRALGPCHANGLTANEYPQVDETVMATSRRHRFSVVEMSVTTPGYFDQLLRLVRPSIGVLTLVARDYFSRFKGVEAIAAEKGKVIAALPLDGIAVLNIDDPLVRAIGETCGRRVIWIGESEGAHVRLLDAQSRYPDTLALRIEYEGKVYAVATTLYGKQLGIHLSWAELRDTQSVQRRVTARFTQKDGHTLHVRKSTQPEPDLARLYDALGLVHLPGGTQKLIA